MNGIQAVQADRIAVFIYIRFDIGIVVIGPVQVCWLAFSTFITVTAKQAQSQNNQYLFHHLVWCECKYFASPK